MISIPRGKIYFSFRALKRIFLSVFKKDISGDKYIRQFERELSDYLGVEHVILTSSGTLSLYLSLKALKIPEDSEVIVSAYTVPEVVSVIILVGAKPVFVDIDPDTYNMNVSLLEGCITSETKVIILTHMYGQPCDIDPVLDLAKRYKLKVIEDVAQALGSEYRERKVGTFGFLSYYSFGIMKNINTLGGGAIATNDTNLADSIRNIISGFGAPDAGELFIKLFKDRKSVV